MPTTDDAGNKAQGFRGYITSRPVNGVPYPHRIQNLVIRDYCQRKGLLFYLSATEGAVPGSFMMLNDVMANLGEIRGIVLFSQFMLPEKRTARQRIYGRIIAADCELHAALEDSAITKVEDVERFEQALTIVPWLAATPFGGRFPGTGPGERDLVAAAKHNS